jgi:cytoskeletal protein CcmA (bactofilin family)
MSNTKRVVGALMIALLVPLVAYGATFRSGDAVDLRPGEIVYEDVYAAGGTVTSGSQIVGDLYAGGGTVLVTGQVSADVVVGGGTVTITSAIGDDLRVGGGTIVVQGTINGDAVIGGGQVHLAGRSIGGDVLAGGGLIRIEAPVGGDVRVGGGEIVINAPVAGNVHVEAEKVTLGSRAVISGNFTYKSPTEAVIEEGAVVRGATTYTPAPSRGAAGAALAAFVSIAMLIKLLMFLVGALVFGLVFRRYSTHIVRDSFSKPLPELGRGLLVLIATPVLSVLLMVTVIGIPLGILGMISFVGLMIFSWLLAPVLLGSFIYQWFNKGDYVVTWQSILIGVLVYTLLGVVPIVGWLVQFGLILLVLGSAVKFKWRLAKEWR